MAFARNAAAGPIRNVADIVIDTSKFNVHELRDHINAQFERGAGERGLTISLSSFGFKNGVPGEATWSSTCASCPIRTLCRSTAS